MTSIPEELRRPQWVLWRTEERDGKPTKVPYQARTRLYRASATDPRTWASYDVAVEMRQRHGSQVSGLGFVFSSDDPYCGIDLDHVWQSDADEGAPWAQGILEQFANTYMEASPSDTGIKIWVRATAPRCGKWPVEDGAIEIYDRDRYFAMTGRHAGVLAITDHQQDIEALVADLDSDAHQDTCPGNPRQILEVIPAGQRHPSLLSLAGTMWRRGMSPKAIEVALLEVNKEQCSPPKPPEAIRKIVKSAQRWKR